MRYSLAMVCKWEMSVESALKVASRYEISIKIASQLENDRSSLGHTWGDIGWYIQVDNNTEGERRFVMLHCMWHKKQGSQATYFRLMNTGIINAVISRTEHAVKLSRCNYYSARIQFQWIRLINNICTLMFMAIEIMVKANLKEFEKRFFGLRHQLKSELLWRNIPVEAIIIIGITNIITYILWSLN